jgi:iron complex outermembrane receptor protein
MTSAVATRSAPAIKPLALACAVSLSFISLGALAQDQDLSTVTITGARFPSLPALAPIAATVITQDEIRRAGATDVDQAIRKIGGVYGRQSLDSSPDFSLDLRGFGADSAQNLVIMLDGVRLNENELASAVLSNIPIDTVERIEITRGGSSVLYGEGASGGVINIITRHAAGALAHGSLYAQAGQFHSHDERATVAQGIGPLTLDAALQNRGTDNYRANNGFKQNSFSGGLQWAHQGGRIGLRVEDTREDARFPGSLTLAEFNADPRQTRTPKDFGSLSLDRVTAFAEQRLGDTELAAELSHRERTTKASYFYSFGGTDGVSRSRYDSRLTQFSPRLRRVSQLDGMLNEAVAGIDLSRWERNTGADFSQAKASQTGKAVYLRDELRWDPEHNGRLAAGARHEVFDKGYADPISFPPAKQDGAQGLNAWEVQGSYAVLAQVDLYAKAGQSYRVANADENGYTVTGGMLAPQTSHDLELGATLGDAARKLTARVFRHNLHNEIFFDPTLNGGFGANTNLDPTRRDGLEIDAEAALAPTWRAIAHAQHVNAQFTEGANAGREMVLVPKNVVTARLAWLPGDGQSADLGAQWVDSQRYGNDFSNSCGARIPSYATIDGRYARKIGSWEFALDGQNLADRHYFSNAFGCKAGIYPSDGRQLKVSLRYEF